MAMGGGGKNPTFPAIDASIARKKRQPPAFPLLRTSDLPMLPSVSHRGLARSHLVLQVQRELVRERGKSLWLTEGGSLVLTVYWSEDLDNHV